MTVLSHVKFCISKLVLFSASLDSDLPWIFLLRGSHQHHLSLSSHKHDVFITYYSITTS